MWQSLVRHEVNQISRIAEGESYAARSRLVRNIDTMLRALRDVQNYWSTYGHLPREQWASDAGIELSHFIGVNLIIWNDPQRSNHYVRTAKNPVFDYRPSDEEWAKFGSLLAKTKGVIGETILGPFIDESGKKSYEIYVVAASPDEGTLIAVVDADEAFEHLLADDSPGYAIDVYWGDTNLYQRGEAGADLPPSWTRDGLIKNSMGVVWNVQHAPTAELARSLQTPAIPAVLVSGIVVSVLIALLLFENGRANRRAAAAAPAQAKIAAWKRDKEKQKTVRTQEQTDRSADFMTNYD
jgi:sensor domain CHASE-containing protein